MATEAGRSRDEIAGWVRDARKRTLEITDDLTDAQMRVPLLAILNPFLWEIGHVAWFQERWLLRHQPGAPPKESSLDSLYDSSAVGHGTRWELALPSRAGTREYLDDVQRCVLERLRSEELGEELAYFAQLAVFHEDMHGEAFLYTRQTLAYPPPAALVPSQQPPGASVEGDAEIPGGEFLLGAPKGSPFVFDNEQWAHPVVVEPFAISRTAVTQGEFVRFVEDGGYRRRELWSPEGWEWRAGVGADRPVYFDRDSGGRWQRRHYDRRLPLEPDRPVIHVNGFEAEAYCHWAGRRLPTETEWEVAAAAEPSAGGATLSRTKRLYPWGAEPPDATRANLDARVVDTVDVGALAAGDSAFGCRQMIGNVWEWTASAFGPYPGFEPGPYRDYSVPWFGTHRVLRGGAWSTRARMVRNTWRSYYTPDRRDVFAGFRTCRADR